MTNRSVLQQVRPLLRDKSGRGYRRRAGQTEDQFLRAVSYRLCAGFVDTWVVRIQDLFQPVCITPSERNSTLRQQQGISQPSKEHTVFTRISAYLIFRATSAALIRGRHLFKHCTRQIFFYIFLFNGHFLSVNFPMD